MTTFSTGHCDRIWTWARILQKQLTAIKVVFVRERVNKRFSQEFFPFLEYIHCSISNVTLYLVSFLPNSQQLTFRISVSTVVKIIRILLQNALKPLISLVHRFPINLNKLVQFLKLIVHLRKWWWWYHIFLKSEICLFFRKLIVFWSEDSRRCVFHWFFFYRELERRTTIWFR